MSSPRSSQAGASSDTRQPAPAALASGTSIGISAGTSAVAGGASIPGQGMAGDGTRGQPAGSRKAGGDGGGDTPWVTPALMTRKTRSLAEIRAVGAWVLWQERRPDEGGRSVVVGRAPDGSLHDLTPAGASVGTEMHVYGGGAWAAECHGPDMLVVYSDRKAGGLWRSFNGGTAQPLCPAEGAAGEIHRYADLSLQAGRLVCVREIADAAGQEVADIVEIGADGRVCSLQSGVDFYMAPRLSADGRFLAFIAWQNPHMPWTETGLYVRDLAADGVGAGSGEDGTGNARALCLAGGAGQDCSVMGPFWEGQRLYALSDAIPANAPVDYERRWVPVLFTRQKAEEGQTAWQQKVLPPASAEIGLPAWVFGQNCCAALPGGRLLARGVRQGQVVTLLYEPKSGWRDVLAGAVPDDVPVPMADGEPAGGGGVDAAAYAGSVMDALARGGGGAADEAEFGTDLAETRFAWLNSPPDAPPSLMTGTLDSKPEEREILRRAWALPEGVGPADIALPETLSFPVSEGPGPLYAQFYRPAEGPHCAPVKGKPPLVVIVHAGPTGQARTDLSFKVQWWTSRGFAVLDVNYRGSTGFGRAYREALDGRWGVQDVQDCCRAVEGVIARGLVDPQRCVIRGSSAGGLTVLSALAESDLFVAGASLYGVTDLRGLVAETHRFEARYLDGLIAPWPEGEAVYIARSPLSWPEKITAPVLFLHGDADKVVPLSQAEALQQHLPDSPPLHVYPGEGHGFRSAEVIVDSLNRELAFYEEVFARKAGAA